MKNELFGDVHVVIGTRISSRGRKPTCPICKKPVLEGQKGVLIKALSETKKEYHAGCILDMAEFIVHSCREFISTGRTA